MWNRSNWCERVILISLGVILFLLVFNVFCESVSYNIWIFIYTVSLIVFSIWATCRDIQFLLEHNTPLKGAPGLAEHSKFNFISSFIPLLKRTFSPDLKKTERDVEPKKKPINISSCADISTIASVIERKFVWAWYSQYVSNEIAFPFACKELLDQMVNKIFQVSPNVDTVGFCSDSLRIILRHCKEYKRASKRLERTGKGRIEEYYRNSHPTSAQRNSLTISPKAKSTQSHCLYLTRAFLKELLPWELWGTPHALLLASILAKRLHIFLSTDLSNPNWLKHKLSQLLEMKNDKTVPHVVETPKICEDPLKPNDASPKHIPSHTPIAVRKDFYDSALDKSIEETVKKTSIESALSNMISNSTASILQRAELERNPSKHSLQNIVINNQDLLKSSGVAIVKKPTLPIDIKSSPSHSLNGDAVSGVTGKNSNEVKIYDKVVDGSVKTWNSDVDLECVSLGRDLLASLDGEVGFESRLGRLWEADGAESSEAWSPNPPSTGSSTKTPYGLWFGEEDTLDMELTEESPPKNMDEAAGMMEGILDFGMAGLRKGLRLTGLQESLQEKGTAVQSSKSAAENVSASLVSSIGQVISSRKNSQSDESSAKSDAAKVAQDNETTEPGKNHHGIQQATPLVKQHHVTSQDSTILTSNTQDREQKERPVSIALEALVQGTESPDYEYEEPADFASTIAKLRSLLQQKTGDITPNSQDDGALILSQNDKSTLPKPTSATQPNNSPVHKPTTNQKIPERTQKPDEIASIPSFESENGFTILSGELFEAEEALNHKVGSAVINNNTHGNGNNMQRLDKLFTRTVTGVFNTIKTAVGGDSLADAVSGHAEVSASNMDKQNVVRAHQHKDDWIFVEGDVDVSILVSKLLVERRGFCVVEVEAAQDSLEVLVATNSSQAGNQPDVTGSTVPDDLDESEIISECPLYYICMELVSVILGGSLQKDAVIKCTSVALADMVEEILRDKLNIFNSWLRDLIINNFRELSKNSDKVPAKVDSAEAQQDHISVQELGDLVLQKLPDVIFKLFGKEETSAAIQLLISSIENPLINRDIVFNLLDVTMLHFLKACLQPSYMVTPPPSA